MKAIQIRDDAFMRVGVAPEDLGKLDGIPMAVAFVGLIINFTLIMAMSSYGWVKATALSAGQPFTAYLALTTVTFGTPTNPSADNKFFCAAGSSSCDLGLLCTAQDDPATFPNALPKNTPAEAWCTAASAGGTTLSLLGCART